MPSAVESSRRSVCRGGAVLRVQGRGCLPVAALHLLPCVCVAALVFVALLGVLGASGCAAMCG